MKIYHHVTGIMNPTMEEVLGKEAIKPDEESEEEVNENYQRREVTFVFEINPKKFLKDGDTIDHISNLLTDMDITTYEFVTKTATSGGIFTELADNVYEDDYEDVDPFHVLFMATDQGFKIDRELIEENFPNALTEKKIGYMCANDYDVFNLIEKETVCYFPGKK